MTAAIKLLKQLQSKLNDFEMAYVDRSKKLLEEGADDAAFKADPTLNQLYDDIQKSEIELESLKNKPTHYSEDFGLSEDEFIKSKEALSDYAGDGYIDINSDLRAGKSSEKADLISALMQPTEEGTFYRSIGSVRDELGDSVPLDNLSEGDILGSKAFASFSKIKPKGKDTVNFELSDPRGLDSIDLNAVDPKTSHSPEMEQLFGPKQNYQILSVDGNNVKVKAADRSLKPKGYLASGMLAATGLGATMLSPEEAEAAPSKELAKLLKNLQKSDPERMKRAAEQGYDTDNIYLHGSPSGDIKSFEAGSYFTPSPDYASWYTEYPSGYVGKKNTSGGAVYPVFLKKGLSDNDLPNKEELVDEYLELIEGSYGDSFPQFLRESGIEDLKYVNAMESKPKSNKIYESVQSLGGGSDIRSIFAKFDPAKTESDDILASAAPYLAATGLAATALSPEDSEAAAASHMLESLGKKVEVLENPTTRDLYDLLGEDDYAQVKALRNKQTGDSFAWKAGDNIHHYDVKKEFYPDVDRENVDYGIFAQDENGKLYDSILRDYDEVADDFDTSALNYTLTNPRDLVTNANKPRRLTPEFVAAAMATLPATSEASLPVRIRDFTRDTLKENSEEAWQNIFSAFQSEEKPLYSRALDLGMGALNMAEPWFTVPLEGALELSKSGYEVRDRLRNPSKYGIEE
jgi:hypothetical protein